MTRYGSVIAVKPEAIAEYRRLHAAVWPEVAARIAASNIRNYTIYLRQPENLLFATFDYHGDDYPADMARMAADPKTRQWWAHTDPLQRKLASAGEDERWAPMEEVFHQD